MAKVEKQCIKCKSLIKIESGEYYCKQRSMQCVINNPDIGWCDSFRILDKLKGVIK